MKQDITLLVITKNSEELLEQTLSSVNGVASEIVIVDEHSVDDTLQIAKKYHATVYQVNNESLGKKRAFGLEKVKTDWVLMLDSDECLSKNLKEEIIDLFSKPIPSHIAGFVIPFQNHLFGKPIKHGGESYKMIRLFHKKKVEIENDLIHEKISLVSGETQILKGSILHYSYRSIAQIFSKFTKYAWLAAEEKYVKKEKVTFCKLVCYPVHMFWARFIQDKGYKDGLVRLPLDIGFAYMEFMTYANLLTYYFRRRS